MKRKIWILLFVPLVSAAFCAQAQKATEPANQEKLDRQIESLRNEAAALAKEGKFSEAADKFEKLQVTCMNNRRYREALDASLKIEEMSQKASDRKSPWNYVRIAEAHLGLGDHEQYFEWMEKAIVERSFSKLSYFQDAHLDAIRESPRFKKIVAACEKEIGLGQKARDFRITLLDGSSFVLSAQAGKVVLIDFWDVRCPPCRREMPNLKKIYEDFRGRGLEMVGISLDTDRKLLDEYLKESKLPWKIACSFNGWSDATAKLYRISATPTTWLIDRRGVVRYYDMRGDELRRAVEQLTQEK